MRSQAAMLGLLSCLTASALVSGQVEGQRTAAASRKTMVKD